MSAPSLLHQMYPIVEPSQVGEARRAAIGMAARAGFDETTQGRLALVATELGTNLHRHATGGRMLLASGDRSGGRYVELLSIDSGPGMSNPANCLRDGYSTAGTPGTGLGAVQRQSDEFSLFSKAGMGTVICARVSDVPLAEPTHRYEFGSICLAAPGETECGDAWGARMQDGMACVVLADGLGHGPDAAVASRAAVRVLDETATNGRPQALIRQAHDALRGTRGAAVAVTVLNAEAGTIAFAGAGNVAGRVVNGTSDRAMLSQSGTVGIRIREPEALEYAWPDHAILVLFSDGLQSRWTLANAIGVLQCDPTVIAAWLVREHLRGPDDCTVVVVRRRAT